MLWMGMRKVAARGKAKMNRGIEHRLGRRGGCDVFLDQ
jgi:hypothetical protein